MFASERREYFCGKEVKKIFIDGAYCGVTVRGAGKQVLLLHGYKSSASSFYYQMNALEKAGYKAIAPDFPGFGSSAELTAAWSVGDYAKWLEKFVRAAGLNKPHIIAHSFGARVVFKYLSDNPQGAEKLIITGGAGVVKPRSPQYIRQVTRYRRIKKLFPRYAERHFGSEEYRTLSPLEKESYKLIVNEDLTECARRIKTPTLLIYGRGDRTTPPDGEGRIFNGCIEGSELEIIDGGHFCFCENSDIFNSLMLSFLEDKGR